MEFNLDKCFECKYDFTTWCQTRGDIDDPETCNGCDMHKGDICHCLTVNNAEDCPNFVPKEENK